MVTLGALLVPIVVSAILVFLASYVVHTVLPLHRNDMSKLPHEERVMDALREAGAPPDDYFFPYCEHSQIHDPEVQKRFERGPVGILTVRPSGPPAMGAALAQWFVYLLVVGVFVAYVTGRVLAPGTNYLDVFQVAGTVAFLAYAGAVPHGSIWWGRRWSTTFKNLFDGLVYGLLTAGVFGWLWPAA